MGIARTSVSNIDHPSECFIDLTFLDYCCELSYPSLGLSRSDSTYLRRQLVCLVLTIPARQRESRPRKFAPRRLYRTRSIRCRLQRVC
jgi:hypothetical protein